MALDSLVKQLPVPPDATPVQGHTASDITSTTEVAIIAAPSDTAKAYYITDLIIQNSTTAEDPTIEIVDTTGTPIILATLVAGKPTLGAQAGHYKFSQPLVVTTGKGISGRAKSSVGDTRITAIGFLGTPALLV